MKNIQRDWGYYLAEVIVVGVGFLVLLNVGMGRLLEFTILGMILVFYLAIGLIRHGRHHDIRRSILFEYIFIALIIALLYFLTSVLPI